MNGTGGIKLLAAVLGFWVIMRTLNKDATGRTLVDRLLGQSGGANQPISVPAPPGSASNPIGTPNAKGQVNPIPGATGGRLDQGFDVTSKRFLSPFAGTVVESEQADAGWDGGGYVAVQSASDPSQVEYFAEGISPLVSKGQVVKAGEAIGRPVINPYNMIVGNIETGPASPSDPLQPLAQTVKDPAQAVRQFYSWLRGLGAPAATSTSNAGRP